MLRRRYFILSLQTALFGGFLKVLLDIYHINDVAIIRVEQFCPFPFGMLKDEITKFKNAEIVWTQEEHKNAGGWFYVDPRINNILKSIGRKDEIRYAGRAYSAATATGYHKLHELELHAFLKDALK